MNEKYIPGNNGVAHETLNTIVEVTPLTEIDNALLQLVTLREAFGVPLSGLAQELFLTKKKQRKAIVKIKNLYDQYQKGKLENDHPGLMDVTLIEEINSSDLIDSYRQHLSGMGVDGKKLTEITDQIYKGLAKEPKKVIKHLVMASNGATNGSKKTLKG